MKMTSTTDLNNDIKRQLYVMLRTDDEDVLRHSFIFASNSLVDLYRLNKERIRNSKPTQENEQEDN